MFGQIIPTEWLQKVSEFGRQIWGAITDIGVRDIIDILIVAYLIYKVILLVVRETRAEQLVKGLILLLVVYVVALALKLKTLTYIMNNVLSIGVLALIIVFQPELRRILERMGRSKISNLNVFGAAAQDEQEMIQQLRQAIDGICESVATMAMQKTGALICIERQTKLGDIIHTGTTLNAELTPELIGSIFFPNSPLHDGAVVVREGKIYAAGCFLPLSESNEINKQLGTRHRSALGMSENSDAIIVVVSEETGIISVAKNGKLSRNFDVVSLKNELISTLIPDKAATSGEKKYVFRKVRKNEESKKK